MKIIIHDVNPTENIKQLKFNLRTLISRYIDSIVSEEIIARLGLDPNTYDIPTLLFIPSGVYEVQTNKAPRIIEPVLLLYKKDFSAMFPSKISIEILEIMAETIIPE